MHRDGEPVAAAAAEPGVPASLLGGHSGRGGDYRACYSAVGASGCPPVSELLLGLVTCPLYIHTCCYKERMAEEEEEDTEQCWRRDFYYTIIN